MQSWGIVGTGEESGASYPTYGNWVDVGWDVIWLFEPLCGEDWVDEYVALGGKFIHYDEVWACRWPKVDRIGIQGDEDGYGDDTFENIPYYGWMRGNFFWGHHSVETPWHAFANEGNNAPVTPPYQQTWETRNPAETHYYTGPSRSNLDNTDPMFFTSARCGDDKVEIDIEVRVAGTNVYSMTTPSYELLPSQELPFEIEVSAPAQSADIQGPFYFHYWDGLGPSFERYTADMAATTNTKATDIKAVYDREEMFFGEVAVVANSLLTTGHIDACDLNGDGWDDFVQTDVDNGEVIVYMSDGPADYELHQIPVPGVNSVSFADFDLDGDLDILANRQPGHTSAYLENNGSGTMTIRDCIECADLTMNTVASAWSDFNGDGLLDILMLTENATMSSVVMRDGNDWGQFVNLPIYEDQGYDGIYLFDYNADGMQDILLRTDGRSLETLFQNTYGSFTGVTEEAGLWHAWTGRAALGDIDNDGDVDIVGEETYLNEGGIFTPHQNSGLPYPTHTIKLVDLDNDGCLDAYLDGKFYVNHDGVFNNQVFTDIVETGNSVMDFADIDDDGDFDAVLYSGNKLYTVKNRGSGNNYLKLKVVNDLGVPFTTGQILINGHASSLLGPQYDSNGLPVTHVGLGTAASATVQVLFGSWHTQEYVLSELNQTVTLMETPDIGPDSISMTRTMNSNGGPEVWTYTWQSLMYSEPEHDQVILDDASMDPVCTPQATVFDASNSATAVSWDSETETFRHTLTYSAGVCDPGCTVYYSVGSSFDGSHYEFSAMQSKNLPTCTPKPPDEDDDIRVNINPNPFNPILNMHITNPDGNPVRIGVYDLRGKLLYERTVTDCLDCALRWDGTALNGQRMPSGMYFVRVECGDLHELRKVMLLK